MSEVDSNLPLWLAFMALAEQATRDPLTGLYNRRYFDETLADHIAAATRYGRPLSLVLLDIDNFKQINDTQGHQAGDTVLKHFANHLKSIVRQADIVCRYGGDEFAILLPETTKNQVQRFVERINGRSASSPTADSENALPPPYSFTAGIAALPSQDLVMEADVDLLAKKTGSRR